jgi:hypothetical protein
MGTFAVCGLARVFFVSGGSEGPGVSSASFRASMAVGAEVKP